MNKKVSKTNSTSNGFKKYVEFNDEFCKNLIQEEEKVKEKILENKVLLYDWWFSTTYEIKLKY